MYHSMTAADLCSMYKPWSTCTQLVHVIMEEFWQQVLYSQPIIGGRQHASCPLTIACCLLLSFIEFLVYTLQ